MIEEKINPVWEKINFSIYNYLKIHILKYYINDLINFFTPKIFMVVKKYALQLPPFVVESEIDDLSIVAQLEFLEVVKVWDPQKNKNIWPLARVRIVGAMKDHIRYITRSDPSRLFDWISDAAYMIQLSTDNNNFVTNIDSSDQLNKAMEVLTDRERKIVIAHTKEDLTFKSIGKRLNISESQTSRIYKKCIEKIRKVIQ